MSDSSNPFGFGKLVPGFDFLQNLMEQANKAGGRGGAAKVPGLSSWIAPTLNVEELDRRISELKAVSFWLDQNAKALSATVQALEVQKMTLATLAGMNVAIGDVAKAFQVKTPAATATTAGRKQRTEAQAAALEGWPHHAEADASGKSAGNPYEKSFQSSSVATAEPAAAPSPAEAAAPAAEPAESAARQPPQPASPSAAGVIDPMQWWGALTSQFQQIASNAMRDAGNANPALAASREMAGKAMKNANRMAASLAGVGAAKKAKAAAPKAAARSTGPASTKKAAGSTGSRKTPAKRAAGRA